MSSSKLQIKQLSNTGELLSVINCFPGQVTVLRATSQKELLPFQRALSGLPGPERFSLTLNDEIFYPSEHELIGFGDDGVMRDVTVRELFSGRGISEHTMSALLTTYDLQGTTGQTVAMLSECQARRVRLLLATQNAEKVLVLNNPFDPIATQWRERFAELVVNFARSKKVFVIVTSLTHRPDCWIDNEFIIRVQVGENIQKTIGFGAGSSQINSMVSHIRETHSAKSSSLTLGTIPARSEKEVVTTGEEAASFSHSGDTLLRGAVTGPHLTHRSSEERKKRKKKRPKTVKAHALTFYQLARPALPAVAVVTLIFFAGAITIKLVRNSNPQRVAELTTPPSPVDLTSSNQGQPPAADNSQIPPAPADPTVATVNLPAPENTPQIPALPVVDVPPPAAEPQTPVEPDIVKTRYVLDEYPPEIRVAVLNTFEGGGGGINTRNGHARKATDSREPPAQPKQVANENVQELLTALQTTNESGSGLPDSQPQPGYQQPGTVTGAVVDTNSMSIEERREYMRQKFREAIERAAAAR